MFANLAEQKFLFHVVAAHIIIKVDYNLYNLYNCKIFII